MQDCYVAT